MTTDAASSSAPSKPAGLVFYRRLGFKVVGAFIALTLTALGVSAYVSVHLAGKGFDRVVHQEFQSTLHFNANFLNSQGTNWTNWARHMTIDERQHGLGHTVLNGNRDDVATYITEHLPTAFSGATTVVDANGRVLHRTHLPSEYGDTLAHVGIVRLALRKREIHVAIVNELNKFMLYAAAPLVVDDKIAGALLIGSAVDNAFVEDIKRNTEVELAVVRDRAVMGSTLKDANGLLIGDLPMPYLEYQSLLAHPDRVLETRFLGERYFVAARRIEMMDGTTPGSLFMAVPRQRLDETEADIYATFLGLLGGISALTIIVGAGVSRNLTRPIVHLSQQVDRISHSGEFEHIESPSKDETGILADSFNTMQDSIRDKNEELKAYSENLEGLVKERTAELIETM
ncbi:HAMP domain-containing protein, partial [Pseudomonadota bacterium]